MMLFLAQYPEADRQQEGMAQRIVAMDEQFSACPRIYLFISHRQYCKKIKREIKPGIYQYHCNTFLHCFFVLSLFRKAKTIYIHSVVHLLAFLLYFPFIPKRAKVIWDIHGLAPEEQIMAGAMQRAKWYSICETKLIHRANMAIAVTQRMIQHFREKYPKAKPHYLVYSILPTHLLQETYMLPQSPTTVPVVEVIYSGNTQKWQNIELMLQIIKANLWPHIHYTLLTGEPEQMKKQLLAYGLDQHPAVCVKKVMPSELKHYYKQAHYGFILRDDIPVNRVACPTKLTEYLFYGILPIVKSADIGDFKAMGYEYIHYAHFNRTVSQRKSSANQVLAKTLLEKEQKITPI